MRSVCLQSCVESSRPTKRCPAARDAAEDKSHVPIEDVKRYKRVGGHSLLDPEEYEEDQEADDQEHVYVWLVPAESRCLVEGKVEEYHGSQLQQISQGSRLFEIECTYAYCCSQKIQLSDFLLQGHLLNIGIERYGGQDEDGQATHEEHGNGEGPEGPRPPDE